MKITNRKPFGYVARVKISVEVSFVPIKWFATKNCPTNAIIARKPTVAPVPKKIFFFVLFIASAPLIFSMSHYTKNEKVFNAILSNH